MLVGRGYYCFFLHKSYYFRRTFSLVGFVSRFMGANLRWEKKFFTWSKASRHLTTRTSVTIRVSGGRNKPVNPAATVRINTLTLCTAQEEEDGSVEKSLSCVPTVDFTEATATRSPGWEEHQPGSISRDNQTYAIL